MSKESDFRFDPTPSRDGGQVMTASAVGGRHASVSADGNGQHASVPAGGNGQHASVPAGGDERTDASPRFRASKYSPYLSRFGVRLPDRTWPERTLDRAPVWCSVDLRDGNQALINPMSLERKLDLYRLLLRIGFPQIEISFPAASRVEFDFTRTLIENRMLPDGVTPQVLVQARSALIERTFDAIRGTGRAIVHLYNSTSELQRRVVFRKDRREIIDLAVDGVRLIRRKAGALAADTGADIRLEYSPESFTGTEIDFALEICEAVMAAWEPTPDRRIILNLPATVEMATPNVYADMIEWFGRHLKNRDCAEISLHTHNDRGTGIAATELGLLAGADRVEGTLFGNGERTGNLDIVALALNLYTQGIDPGLRLDDLPAVREVHERCTEIPVHPRHPYAGDLVFSAFSGSHQDAISKGFRALRETPGAAWEVPYFAIDPADIGRHYEPVIRINSQSGKGGAAFVMRTEFGCDLPKEMHPEFGAAVQRAAEAAGGEIPASAVWEAFSREYLEPNTPYRFLRFRSTPSESSPDTTIDELTVEMRGEEKTLTGSGNGPIDACRGALLGAGCPPFRIENYWEHARSAGSDAEAVAYLLISTADAVTFGAGIDRNTSHAAIKALLSALNRAFAK